MGHMQEKVQVGNASDWYHGSMYCAVLYCIHNSVFMEPKLLTKSPLSVPV